MPSRSILDADPALQAIWPKLINHFHARLPHYRLHVVETHVPPEEQLERFHIGRNGLGEIVKPELVQTDLDGTDMMSPKNYYPSLAIEFKLTTEGGLTVCDAHALDLIADICRTKGIVLLGSCILLVKKATPK
jgi:hypothetical protein